MEHEPTLPMKRKLPQEDEQQIPPLRISRITSEDRISGLPDSIIHHILSFATVKDAIKFCSLSKQWKPIWTSIPNLLFRCDDKQNFHNFATFVDKALELYSAPKVKTFLLDIDFNKEFKDQVQLWLHFAATHEVEELYLKYNYQYRVIESWSWNWISLKVLSLVDLGLGIGIVRSIFRGSPLIESLTLRECVLAENLGTTYVIDASDTTLKILVIDNCEIDYGHDMRYNDFPRKGNIEINCPDLQSLTMVGEMYAIGFKLVDVLSLVEANVGFSMDRCSAKERKMIMCMLEKLYHVDQLIVGSWILQGLSIMRLDREIFPTFACRSLKLNLRMTKMYLPGMEVLLHASPSLKQLIVNVIAQENHNLYRRNDTLKENYWRSETRTFDCLNQNLERVEIIGFDAGNPSWNWSRIFVEMVQFLLDNSKVLQRLIVHAQVDNVKAPLESAEPKKLKNLFEIKENLLQYPRASPDAVILFESGRRLLFKFHTSVSSKILVVNGNSLCESQKHIYAPLSSFK